MIIHFFISFLLAGLAGWLASFIFKGSRLGLFGYILIGFVGGVIGQIIFNVFNLPIHGGYFRDLVIYFIGSLFVLFIINLLRKRNKNDDEEFIDDLDV